MRIGVDAVGGDHYPVNPVQGGLSALSEDAALSIVFFGPRELIDPLIADIPDDVANRISVHHAPQIVSMDESASAAVKSKPDSSITHGLKAHKSSEIDAFVSAGNTGALLGASMLILGKLDGVIRPTIGTHFPTLKGFRLLMDAGANLEIKPEHFLQFAKMGRVYSAHLMGIDDPKVGMLNVGEEDEKGTEEMREAFGLLSNLPYFAGNMEGRDIFPAKADVFLCNGLVGNLLLKFGESIPDTLAKLIGKTMKEKGIPPEQQMMIGGLLRESLSQFDYENVGGVPFLGVNGVSMVGHGGSTPKAIRNMILNAAKCVRGRLNEKIIQSL